ncbi:MAG: thioredoxin [Planctomycetota bacterium]
MSSLPEVTDSTFEAEVLKSDLPVLVDFSAEWCGPCKSLAPIVEELAGEYEGRVKFLTLNIDNSRQTPSAFGIMAVPTLILFKNGEVADKVTGFKPKPVLQKHLESLVA